MKVCSHVCGIVFDPLAEGYVEVCEECELADAEHDEQQASKSFYLGDCGLIADYLL